MRDLALKNPKEIFNYFVGSWHIERVITDRITAKGVAIFNVIKKNHLFYREDLKLQKPDASDAGRAYQKYFYIYDLKSQDISKYFSDMRLFYNFKFDFTNQVSYGQHFCNQDLYVAEYKFLDLNRFTLSYTVNGPTKDYKIFTQLFRKINVY